MEDRMKRNTHLLLLVFGVLMMTLMFAMVAVAEEEEEAIIGTVAAATTDSSGKVTAVKIIADEGEYLVENNDKGKELLKLVDKDVDASGTVKEKDGKKTITVTEFEVIEE
jgi:hypothetical protein